MRSPKPATLAVLVAVLLFWGVLSPATAHGGGMTVSADYELFGTSSLTGGGHVTWTLTGDVARQLRANMVHLFDEYPQIPRGFLFRNDPTNGNHDGILEEPEGRAYTDRLENVLEGLTPASQTAGTPIGYFLLDRADLLEKDLVGGFNRSTSGIVGKGANDTDPLQIKFLFNGATDTADMTMPLTTTAYANALFDVFSIEANQSGSWPLPAAGDTVAGWHNKYYDAAHPAVLWAGNLTSCANLTAPACRYDNNATLDATSVMDTSAMLGAAGAWLDLRFASAASITFDYTGRVAGTGDAVRVQVAPVATSLSWTTLPGGTFSVGQNTPAGQWSMAALNLSAYLGEKVRIRLRFATDASGTAPGFFLSNFAIHAPCQYAGSILESDAHYLVGLLSFSNLQVPSGSPTLIRTPGGELLFYSDAFSTIAPSPDSVRYESIDVMENPQVLFVVMIIAAYFISRLQESAYDGYREAHPNLYRPAVRKAKWLHWVGKIAIALLILFYFVPTAFFFAGLRVYFNGPAYFFFALTAALTIGFGTRAYYQQLLETAPPPAELEPAPAPEPAAGPSEPPSQEPAALAHCTHCLRSIPEGERTYACSCGAIYHLNCASGLMRCPNCRKPMAALEHVGEARSVSMRCESCGEIQTVPEGADPRTLACASCGGSLRGIDAGKRYLLVASNPAIAFHWLADLSKGGKPCLVFSPAAPDRLRLEFGLKDAAFVQVASQGADAIDPKKLDPVGLKAVLPLTRGGKGGVLLYDGLEQMIAASSMGDIVRFLRKANDMAFVHKVTVIARVGPGVLADLEIQRLAGEFDEVLDLSARL